MLLGEPAAIRHSDRLSLSEVVAVAVPRTLGKTEGLAAAAAAVADLMPVGAAQRGKASSEEHLRHLVRAGQAEAAQRQRVRVGVATPGAMAVVEQVRVSPARLLVMPVAVAAVPVRLKARE